MANADISHWTPGAVSSADASAWRASSSAMSATCCASAGLSGTCPAARACSMNAFAAVVLAAPLLARMSAGMTAIGAPSPRTSMWAACPKSNSRLGGRPWSSWWRSFAGPPGLISTFAIDADREPPGTGSAW